MRHVTRWIVASAVGGVFCAIAVAADAQTPDFSGTWVLDLEKSDDLGEKVLAGAGDTDRLTQIEVKRISDRLTLLARAGEEIEIEQTEADFKIFDKSDNVRIYYIDGEKHARQTPWGAKLQTLTDWDDEQLVITTEGEELGKVTETYSFEGRQLVFVVQMEVEGFASAIVARSTYQRKEEQ